MENSRRYKITIRHSPTPQNNNQSQVYKGLLIFKVLNIYPPHGMSTFVSYDRRCEMQKFKSYMITPIRVTILSPLTSHFTITTINNMQQLNSSPKIYLSNPQTRKSSIRIWSFSKDMST